VDKIHSQKKAIEEGSREREILYRKYDNEELGKLSSWAELLFAQSPYRRNPVLGLCA